VTGKQINSEQIKLYTAERSRGRIQRTAAAIAGISERSGRRIEKGELQPGGCHKRYWRTHPDFFADVWETEIVPLLTKDSTLKAISLFKYLQKKYPGRYSDGKLRTFQRRVSRWKHLHCRTREVSVKGRITGKP
jgi:hypothetical protein